jgi:uncharacterized protein YihD (DUF1040 family)
MRDPKRIDKVLAAVKWYWMAYPDLRLGQVIENARSLSGFAGDTFNMEEDDLLRGLQELSRVGQKGQQR